MGMELRELGRTGVEIPAVGFGTWKYRGGPDLLRKAIDLGASLIDTAEYYGNEEVVGQAIRGIRDRVFVATKANHWRRHEVLRSAEASLGKLGVECIDLYQLHWPNGAVPMEDTFSAFATLAEQGKIRFVGVSNFSIGEMKRAQEVLGRHRLVSNQVRFSLVDRTIEPRILPHCQTEGVTVLAYSPLGHSFLRLSQADKGDVLGQVAKATGKTKAQVALNWCLRHRGLVVIPKTESEMHLAENCLSSGWKLSEEHTRMLTNGIRFRRRSRLESALRRLARNNLQRWRALRRRD